MTRVNAVTDVSRSGDVALITLDSPPVNALSAAVREGLAAAFEQAIADESAKAVVLICAGRTFIAGADISELDSGGKVASIEDVQTAMERSPKPVVAAIHGTALGGGLEVALCAHFRIAVPSAKLGLPEVNLGLLPGGGGTQRLPRLVGVPHALEMMTSGRHVPAKECLLMGLVDRLAPEGDLESAAIGFALEMAARGGPFPVVRDSDDKVLDARMHPEIFASFRKANAELFRGFRAPEANIRCVEAAARLPFEEGLAAERALFIEVLTGEQSAAQRYAFFAERLAGKIPDVPEKTAPMAIGKLAVVAAGGPAREVAAAFAAMKIPTAFVAAEPDSAESVPRGGPSGAGPASDETGGRGFDAFEALTDCDLVIAVFKEGAEVDADLVARLDGAMKPNAILAVTGLDVDDVARATSRADRVAGLHVPPQGGAARLLGLVRGGETSPETIVTLVKLARTVGRIAVVAKPSPRFFGSRMLAALEREAQALVLEGATPWEVDRILYDFGFPRGPFAAADLAGLDVSEGAGCSTPIGERLCAAGRRGKGSGGGYYDYHGDAAGEPSPATEAIVVDWRRERSVDARTIPEEKILHRCIDALVNEAADILDEGKAIRASDIDIAWIHGYGWPAYRGGPTYHADRIGLENLLARMKGHRSRIGGCRAPSRLLERLAAEGRTFADL